MTKGQAIQAFWEGFGIPAYDETTVPQNAQMPYITYGVSTGNVGNMIVLHGSLWYHDTSWRAISEKAEQIAEAIGYGYALKKIDNGYIWITQRSPYAQRMSDEDATVRRMYIVLNAEFLTAF